MAENEGIVEGMRLSSSEIDALERYVSMIEQADKNRVDFQRSDAVAFTPGALLVVAVAKFVYDVYQDYGKVAISVEDLQSHLKGVARELARLEAGGEESLNVDTYARFRQDLMAAKRASR